MSRCRVLRLTTALLLPLVIGCGRGGTDEKAMEEANRRNLELARSEGLAASTFDFEIQKAKDAGRPDAELALARDYQRKAQFYLDFVEAENSMGFHAPAEAARILGESMNFSRLSLMALSGVKPTRTDMIAAAK